MPPAEPAIARYGDLCALHTKDALSARINKSDAMTSLQRHIFDMLPLDEENSMPRH